MPGWFSFQEYISFLNLMDWNTKLVNNTNIFYWITFLFDLIKSSIFTPWHSVLYDLKAFLKGEVLQSVIFYLSLMFETRNLYFRVRSLNFTRLVGAGILHTKLWLVDRKHFYVGSANFDWRSLTQVFFIFYLNVYNVSPPTLRP